VVAYTRLSTIGIGDSRSSLGDLSCSQADADLNTEIIISVECFAEGEKNKRRRRRKCRRGACGLS